MDDRQLTLRTIAERAEQLGETRPVVTRRPDGSIHRTTLAASAARARRLAGALRALGIGEGDVVATLLHNQAEHLELYLAVPTMGAVLHTLNPRLHPQQLDLIAADGAGRTIVVDASLLGTLRRMRARFEHVVVVSADGARSAISARSQRPVSPHSRPQGRVSPHSRPQGPVSGSSPASEEQATLPAGALDYESMLRSTPLDWPDLSERLPAMMCHTSGTTGRPKGVVHSHRALLLHALVASLPDVLGVGARDVVMPVVPMFHANAWGLPHAAALCGAALVLPGPRTDALSLLELLSRERVTVTAGVPTVWMSVLEALDAEPSRFDLRSLRRVRLGGSAPSRSLLEAFDRHGIPVDQGWGMTETAPLATVCLSEGDGAPMPEGDRALAAEQLERRLRQGAAIPLVELRARGRDGELIPCDDKAMGELEVRGPWVVSAYHGGVGADSFTEDGWLRTGDVVRIDRRGAIRVCDRAKDLVRSGGEWISSVELENHLMCHRSVAEAAVVAVPDERWGERPLAAVVLRDGMRVTPEELRQHLRRRFERWQLPDRIELVASIPRTATGKFQKAELRRRFAG